MSLTIMFSSSILLWQEFCLFHSRVRAHVLCVVCVCVCAHTPLIHSDDGYHGWFHTLAIVSSTYINPLEPIALFMSFRCILITGLLDHMFYFKFSKNSPYCSHSGCTKFASHQQRVCSPFFTSSLLGITPCLLITDILIGVRYYLTMVLICISLMASNSEHLFKYFVAVCISSFENHLVRLFAHLLVHFSYLSCWYILDINLLSNK